MKRNQNYIVVSLDDIGRGAVAKRTRRALSLSPLERALSTNLLQLVLLHLEHGDERALAQTCACLLARARRIWVHTKRWVLKNRTQLKLPWLQEARCIELAPPRQYRFNHLPPHTQELVVNRHARFTADFAPPPALASLWIKDECYFDHITVSIAFSKNTPNTTKWHTILERFHTIKRLRVDSPGDIFKCSFLPPHLEELTVSCTPPVKRYVLNALPVQLQRLTLGPFVEGSIYGLPSTLKYLSIFYMHAIDIAALPSGLEHIVLYHPCFSADFNFDEFPRGIKTISIQGVYKNRELYCRDKEWLLERLVFF